MKKAFIPVLLCLALLAGCGAGKVAQPSGSVSSSGINLPDPGNPGDTQQPTQPAE